MTPRRNVNRPSTGDYLMMYFPGPCTVEDCHGERREAAGSLIVFTPQMRQVYGNPAARWSHSWMHLEGMLLRNRMERLGLPVGETIHCPSMQASFERLLRELNTECSEVKPLPEVACGLLEIFLLRLARAVAPSGEEPPPGLDRARRAMENTLQRPWTLEEIAREAGMSVSYASELFKLHYQEPPMRYLRRLRMSQAAFLLRTRHTRIGEVAAECGYDDIFHFSKAFKHYHGMSPTEYRRAARVSKRGKQD
jgi:AraC family transcriptional regulator of arabinose operon